MRALSEFLFKYPSAMFERGALGFASRVPMAALVVVGLLVLAVSLLPYLRVVELRRRDRFVLIGLRAGVVSLLLFCLARPVLVVSEAIPQRNVVAVVVDDSRSMRVADVANRRRGDEVLRLIGGRDSALIKALEERFQVRYFRTSGAGGRSTTLGALPFDGSRTRLVSSLSRAGDELTGAPVAGFVLLSDGADNTGAVSTEEGVNEQLVALRARGIPVYAVGIGSERFAKDVEIARIDAPRAVLKDGTLMVDIVLTQQGYGGVTLPVVVEDGGRIVGSKSVTMPRDGEAAMVRVRVPTTEAGARALTVRVPVQPSELVKENNERRLMVRVRDRREKILYVEGEPRFELKFMRRAVEGDANLQLVTLLRSAKDKYLRMGVDDSLELASGFPATREELFSYRAVVLGSIEASAFTVDQLRMLSDFVGVRGGGLLALGGRRALAEGGYAGTPLAELMPVGLGATPFDSAGILTMTVGPTPAGVLHPAMQLAATDSLSALRWATLPPLTVVNALGPPKPAATVLLSGTVAEERGTHPVFAFERFGRGKAGLFAVQDSWQWQMAAEIPVDDQTHETLWRQVLRWLVSDAPDRLDIAAPDDAGPGEALTLRASVADKAFLHANGAAVSAVATLPSGARTEVPFEWVPERDGEYRGSLVADAPGNYEVRARAVVGSDTVWSEPEAVRVSDPATEYFASAMRPGFLRQVAEETGGKYYGLGDALQVAKDMVYSRSGATVVEKHDLWDMPVLFLLLTGLLGGEWLWRRRRGLA